MKKQFFLVLPTSLLLLSACRKKDAEPVKTETTSYTVAGQIISQHSKLPVVGARIAMYQTTSKGLDPSDQQTITDSAGRFTFTYTPVPGGAEKLVLYRTGFVDYSCADLNACIVLDGLDKRQNYSLGRIYTDCW